MNQQLLSGLTAAGVAVVAAWAIFGALRWFLDLSLPQKVNLLAVTAAVLVVVGVLGGWLPTSAITSTYRDAVQYATEASLWYEGLTRRYPIVPVLWLVALVVLCWPTHRGDVDEDA